MRKILKHYFSGLSMFCFLPFLLHLQTDTFCPICERADSQFEGELAQNSSISSISQSLFSPNSLFGEGNGSLSVKNDNNELANFVAAAKSKFDVGNKHVIATVFPSIRFNW
jgi:hypothetical protein